jgi:hypothetical protein
VLPDFIPRQSVLALPLWKSAKVETVLLLYCLLSVLTLLAIPLQAAVSGLPSASTNPIAHHPDPAESSDQTLTRSSLDQQIERVLQNPEFNWRQPSAPAHDSKNDSVLEQVMSSIRQMMLLLGNTVDRLLKSLLDLLDPKHLLAQPGAPETPLSPGILNTLGYILWAAFAGTLILFAFRILKLKMSKRPEPIAPTPPKPDIANEAIAADQLPDDEWVALAREMTVAGAYREAQRALFLAILSYLASHRLITVERWKSNSDYEKELGRKAKHLSELPPLFAQSRLGFERCWYGANSVTRQDLEDYTGIYERIKHAAT